MATRLERELERIKALSAEIKALIDQWYEDVRERALAYDYETLVNDVDEILQSRTPKRIRAELAYQAYEEAKTGNITGRAAVVEQIIILQEDKVRNSLKRMRLYVPEDEPITPELILQTIRQRTGIELEGFENEDILRALQTPIKTIIESELGLEVQDILKDSLKKLIKDQINKALQSGKANRYLGARKIKMIRTAVTWAEKGYGMTDRRRVLSRWYSKKYRKKHYQIWI